MVLDYTSAHRFVDKTKDARWEGWDIIMFKNNPAAASKVAGRFNNGRWGFETRVTVESNGTWRIPTRNARPTS